MKTKIFTCAALAAFALFGGEVELNNYTYSMMNQTYEIVPQEPYPFSYDECCDVASQELADDARPALAGELPDVSAYDTVFLGCPIWWGSEPMVVRSFLDGVDLTGKTIVPFTTHGGSGLGSVPENLRERIGGASFLEAKAVAGTDVDGARDEVVEWVRSLGL